MQFGIAAAINREGTVTNTLSGRARAVGTLKAISHTIIKTKLVGADPCVRPLLFNVPNFKMKHNYIDHAL